RVYTLTWGPADPRPGPGGRGLDARKCRPKPINPRGAPGRLSSERRPRPPTRTTDRSVGGARGLRGSGREDVIAGWRHGGLRRGLPAASDKHGRSSGHDVGVGAVCGAKSGHPAWADARFYQALGDAESVLHGAVAGAVGESGLTVAVEQLDALTPVLRPET